MMKSKVSSGYLTPQANKRKQEMDNLSGSKKGNNKHCEINDDVFKALMQCPEKKKMILKLLALNKNAIKEYQQKDTEGADSVKKLQKNVNVESPTALFRRRALEQMNSPQSPSQVSMKELTVKSANPVPYDKVFEGVTAYVEIISNGEDRSEAVKSVLRSMGAKVKDRISSDVTHVIFKGGSFTTFNKASIIKAYIVSVLWVEASRNALQKQDEKLYHAIKTTHYNHDSSLICKKLEKEYEDTIKDEFKRSVTEGVPLPSTNSLINRRRTMMPSAGSSGRHDSFAGTLSPARNSIQNNKQMKSVCLDSLDMEVAMIDCDKSTNNNGSKESFVRNSVKTGKDDTKNTYKRRLFEKRKTICSVSTDTDKTPSNVSANGVTENLHENPATNSVDESIIFGMNSVITKNVQMNADLSNKMSKIQVSSEDVMSKLAVSLDVSKTRTSSSRRKSVTKARQSQINTDSSTLSDLETSKSSKIQVLSEDVSQLASSSEDVSNRKKRPIRASRRQSVLAKSLKSQINTESSTLSDLGTSEISSKNVMSQLAISTEDVSNKESISRRKSSVEKALKPQINRESSTLFDFDVSKVSSPDVMSQLAVSSEEVSNKEQTRPTQSSRRKSVASNACQLQINTESLSKSSNSDILIKHNRRSLRLSTINSTDASSSSKMSDLRVSSENTRSSMSSLRVSSKEHSESTKSSMSPFANGSFSSSEKNSSELAEFIDKVVNSLKPSVSENDNSDDSEILSPKPRFRKLIPIKEKRPKENQNSSSSSSCSSGGVKIKRKRKLYNPDEPIALHVNDEEEREQRREQKLNKSKDKSDDTSNTSNEDESANNLQSKKTQQIRKENDSSSSDEDCRVVKIKKVRKAKKKREAEVDFDSSADEQRDLMEEIMSAKEIVGEDSSRPSQFIKPSDKSGINLKENRCPDPVTPYRRSTMDFLPPSQINSAKRLRRTDFIKLPTIVCTKLHSNDVKFFTEAVNALGRFTVENAVSNNTTHLVAGEPKRTINMMKAISRGCWVVSFDWVLKSLEKGKWLPEDDFEIMDFAPIVQKSRLQRQAFGSHYSMDVFENCGPIFVGFNTNPKCSDLKELVLLCKGKLVNTKRRARIVIGEGGCAEDAVCVTELWILDCIKKNRLLPFRNTYLLNGNKRQSIVV